MCLFRCERCCRVVHVNHMLSHASSVLDFVWLFFRSFVTFVFGWVYNSFFLVTITFPSRIFFYFSSGIFSHQIQYFDFIFSTPSNFYACVCVCIYRYIVSLAKIDRAKKMIYSNIPISRSINFLDSRQMKYCGKFVFNVGSHITATTNILRWICMTAYKSYAYMILRSFS